MVQVKVIRKIMENPKVKRVLLAEIPIYRCPNKKYKDEFNKNYIKQNNRIKQVQ